MNRNDNLKTKTLIFLASIALSGFIVLLYFLDNSLSWGLEKIISCIIVNIWMLFIFPSIRNSLLQNKGKSFQEWFVMGFKAGASGIVYSVLFAPYYGIKYYFN